MLGAPRKAEKSCAQGLGEEAGRVGPRGPEVSGGKEAEAGGGAGEPQGPTSTWGPPKPSLPEQGLQGGVKGQPASSPAWTRPLDSELICVPLGQ